MAEVSRAVLCSQQSLNIGGVVSRSPPTSWQPTAHGDQGKLFSGARCVSTSIACLSTVLIAASQRRARRGMGRTAIAALVEERTTSVAQVQAGEGLDKSLGVRGVLSNGLRYVFVPHALPEGRVEAHLEFHVGSVEENPSQRGMAHLLEHVCFLGSNRRRQLQSTGTVSSNALTDFHHTIYHMSLESKKLGSGLECLREIGFEPAFETERVEKERAAVLSEAQMVNDVAFRMRTDILTATNSENVIHERMPIGLVEQIAEWSPSDLRAFHEKWYVPENATIYIVGDTTKEQALLEVERVFADVAQRAQVDAEDAWAFTRTALFRPELDGRPSVLHKYVPNGDVDKSDPTALDWSSELLASVTQDELMQGMQIHWSVKKPLKAPLEKEDLADWLCSQLIVEAVRLRVQSQRHLSKIPVTFRIHDSLQEGASVTSLTIMTEPLRWKETCGEIITELKTLAKFGMLEEELLCTKRLVLNKIESSAKASPLALMGTLSADEAASTSREMVEALIKSIPSGHLLTRASEFWEAVDTAATSLSLMRVNKACKEALAHFGDKAGKASGVVLLSCPTTLVDEQLGRRTPMAPPSQEECISVLRAIEPLQEKEISKRCLSAPESLLPQGNKPEAVLARHVSNDGVVACRLKNGMRVRFLVKPGTEDGAPESSLRLKVTGGRMRDLYSGNTGAAEMGVKMLEYVGVGEWTQEEIMLFARLNGVNIEISCEPDAAVLEAHFASSRSSVRAALEWLHWLIREPRVDLTAFSDAQLRLKGEAQALEKSLEGKALRQLQEMMYPAAPWLWTASVQQINCVTLGLARKAILEHICDLESMELQVVGIVPNANSSASSLSHDDEVAGSGGPIDEEAGHEMQTLLEEEVSRVMNQLTTDKSSAPPVGLEPVLEPVMAASGGEQYLHIPDSQERGIALIGGGAPSYWGQGDFVWEDETMSRGFAWGAGASNKAYPAKATQLMVECMNTRLLSVLRDRESLTYNADLSVEMFDSLKTGYFICKLYSTPSRLGRAVEVALNTLRSPEQIPFSEWEVDAAKKVLLFRDSAKRRERGYWLNCMSGAGDAWKDPAEEEAALKSLTPVDVQRAFGALTKLTDPFVVMGSSGPGSSPQFDAPRIMRTVSETSTSAGSPSSSSDDMAFLD